MVPQAPLAILVCGDRAKDRWPQYWDQDCAAATENLLIAAAQLGLGAVWLGVHPLEERVDGVRALLGIPSHITPFSLVPVGWPAEEKAPPTATTRARAPRPLVTAGAGSPRAGAGPTVCLIASRGTSASDP